MIIKNFFFIIVLRYKEKKNNKNMCLSTLPKPQRKIGKRVPFDLREAVLRKETLKTVIDMKTVLPKVTKETIRDRAYILWKNDYSQDSLKNWLEAKRQLNHERHEKLKQLMRERYSINIVSSEMVMNTKQMISLFN